jgi:hypothetical protein
LLALALGGRIMNPVDTEAAAAAGAAVCFPHRMQGEGMSKAHFVQTTGRLP